MPEPSTAVLVNTRENMVIKESTCLLLNCEDYFYFYKDIQEVNPQ